MSPAAATTGSAAWETGAKASPRAAQRAMGSFIGGDCTAACVLAGRSSRVAFGPEACLSPDTEPVISQPLEGWRLRIAIAGCLELEDDLLLALGLGRREAPLIHRFQARRVQPHGLPCQHEGIGNLTTGEDGHAHPDFPFDAGSARKLRIARSGPMQDRPGAQALLERPEMGLLL